MSNSRKLLPWSVVLVLLFLVLATTIGVFVRQAFNRIDINPQAITAAWIFGVNETLAKGGSEKKLQTITALEKMGADAKPFVPALIAAARESDPAISAAAHRAISAIDPGSTKEMRN